MDTLNILTITAGCVSYLLYIITETINTLFRAVNFLKRVATELVLYSVVGFKTLKFHKVM